MMLNTAVSDRLNADDDDDDQQQHQQRHRQQLPLDDDDNDNDNDNENKNNNNNNKDDASSSPNNQCLEQRLRNFYDKLVANSIAFLNNLNKYELAIFMALVTLCSIQILFILMSLTNFFLLTFNLLRVFMTVFCLFSIYTWLSILYGSYWSESSIYLTFFTCFLSEFFIQFITYNLNNAVSSINSDQQQQQQQKLQQQQQQDSYTAFRDSDESNSNSNNLALNDYASTAVGSQQLESLLLTDNARHVLLIGTLCILISLISKFRLRENILLIVVICLTRLYGSIYFSSFMPFSICSYFTYLCAFSGIIFSEYIKVKLNYFNCRHHHPHHSHHHLNHQPHHLNHINNTHPNQNNNNLGQIKSSGSLLLLNKGQQQDMNGQIKADEQTAITKSVDETATTTTTTTTTTPTTATTTTGSNNAGSNNNNSKANKFSLPNIKVNNNNNNNNSNGHRLSNGGGTASVVSRASLNKRRKQNTNTNLLQQQQITPSHALSNVNCSTILNRRRTSLPIILSSNNQANNCCSSIHSVSKESCEKLIGENSIAREINTTIKRLQCDLEKLNASTTQLNTLKKLDKLFYDLISAYSPFSPNGLTRPSLPFALQNGLTKESIIRNYPPLSYISSTTNSESTTNENNLNDLSDNFDEFDNNEDDESKCLTPYMMQFPYNANSNPIPLTSTLTSTTAPVTSTSVPATNPVSVFTTTATTYANSMESHKYKFKRNRGSLPSQILNKKTSWSSNATNATGFTNIEPAPPSRQRTLSFHVPSNQLSFQATLNAFSNSQNLNDRKAQSSHNSLNKSSSSLPNADHATTDANTAATSSNILLNNHVVGSPTSVNSDPFEPSPKDASDSMISNSSNGSNKVSKMSQLVKTSDYESSESPNNSDYNSDTDRLLSNSINNSNNNNNNNCNKDTTSFIQTQTSQTMNKLAEIKEEASMYQICSKQLLSNSTSDLKFDSLDSNEELDVATTTTTTWSPTDLDGNEHLEMINEWSFPIFDFYSTSDDHVLSQMSYKIFKDIGLLESFEIPEKSFIAFFSALEKGYMDLPYHNKIHAADVLHACFYLTTQLVPGLLKADINQLNNSQYKERTTLNSNQTAYSNSNFKHAYDTNTYGCVGYNLTPLELLALYCSAAMHDYKHPGRNNQFLVNIKSELALLYNDKSVLENYHASASWKLLVSNSKYNFLNNLESAEWKRFRFLVLENILATDLNRHFTIIKDFKTRTMCQPNNIEWKNEADRLLVCQVVLKLADINAPLKERDLHLKWTERIVEEFYLQGEEEAKMGMPVSQYMDRKFPRVAELQESFINNLVGSLFVSYEEAGLLPGIYEDQKTTTTDDEQSDADDHDATLETKYETTKKHKRLIKTKLIKSELRQNFNSNYKFWTEKIKAEKEQSTV